MLSIQQVIEQKFKEALAQNDVFAQDGFPDDLVLLSSGLDSLGFAILVTRLEQEFGYDPFLLMEEPFYPRTFGEFVSVYERFAEHRKHDLSRGSQSAST